MNKKYRYLRAGIAVIVGILSILAFAGIIYPLKIFDIQFSALLQRLLVDFSITATVLFAALLIMTLIFGRVYCSTLCPFGLLQEFLMLLFRRKNKPQKNRAYKYFLSAVVFGILVGGTTYAVRLIDPYTLFGSGMSLAWLGLTTLGVIAALVWFKGRFFCSNICPVGAVLGIIAKHAVNKIYIDDGECISCGACAAKCPTGSIDFKNKSVDNETCIKCFNCMSGCKRSGVHYGIKPSAEVAFSPSRRRLLLGGAVVATFALAVKGGMEWSKAIAAKVKKAILPAGTDNAEDFANRCLNCNLCVQNCPMKIIKKADADYPTVHLDYSDSFCDYDCHKCAQVCPSGAIKKLSLAEKQKTQIGLAQINEDKCIKCGLCVMKCPRQIIRREDGEVPQISADDCIGCGACQSACPVKAIKISAVLAQKIVS